MSMNIVVGYDGSESSMHAINFAAERAKALNGELIIAFVLHWSPYTFLTPTELEERHARRTEEMKRAEKHIAPIVSEYAAQGITVKSAIKYGHVADTIIEIAKEQEACQIVIGRSGDTGISNRIFGSVAGSLAQSAPVPVTIIP